MRRRRLRRIGAYGLWGARSVRGAAGIQEVGELHAAPGSLLSAGRPPARVHLPGAERPQQDRSGAGDACPAFAGGGGERRALGKGHAVDDGGLRPAQLSHFQAEILGMEGEEVLFSRLRCYTKDARTILAAHNKPCELHPGAPDPGEVLPPTRHVEWAWRRQKTHRIGIERPSCELLEAPEIAEGRHLSTLSTRGRLQRQEELLEAAALLDWEARIRLVAERLMARAEELAAEREREKALLEAAVQRRRGEIAARSRARGAVEEALLGNTQKVADIAGKAFDILGARTTERGGRRVVLREEGGQPAICVWATRGLERILDNQEGVFEAMGDGYGRRVLFLPHERGRLLGQPRGGSSLEPPCCSGDPKGGRLAAAAENRGRLVGATKSLGVGEKKKKWATEATCLPSAANKVLQKSARDGREGLFCAPLCEDRISGHPQNGLLPMSHWRGRAANHRRRDARLWGFPARGSPAHWADLRAWWRALLPAGAGEDHQDKQEMPPCVALCAGGHRPLQRGTTRPRQWGADAARGGARGPARRPASCSTVPFARGPGRGGPFAPLEAPVAAALPPPLL